MSMYIYINNGINHPGLNQSQSESLAAFWVKLNGKHASAPPPVVQRQEGDGTNAADPVGMVGLVDRPCINVQPAFRPLHVVA